MTRARRFALAAAAAALVSLAVWRGFPLCPLASSFGIPCPGCGLTRATLALLHGDLHGALRIHPLVWLLSPLFVGFLGSVTFEFLRDPDAPRRTPLVRWNGRAVTAFAALVLVLTLGVWLLRFNGYFGGPVPVTSLASWLAGQR